MGPVKTAHHSPAEPIRKDSHLDTAFNIFLGFFLLKCQTHTKIEEFNECLAHEVWQHVLIKNKKKIKRKNFPII